MNGCYMPYLSKKYFVDALSPTRILFAVALLLSPTSPVLLEAQAVVITIVNDLSPDKEGSVIEVDGIKALGVKPGIKINIMPGQQKKVAPRHTFAFTVSQAFGDYKEKYQIECPADKRIDTPIKVTLADIKVNSLPQSCTVIRKGKWYAASGTQWDHELKHAPPIRTSINDRSLFRTKY